jgi:Uma2 family endonuclease
MSPSSEPPLLTYAHRTPRRGDIALVVEVSDTTYQKDTGKKLRGYQRAGIPTYWVVDLNRRRVEVREMTARGLAPVVLYHEQDEIPLTLDGRDYGKVPVRELLP